eukprot:gene5893-6134_t
MAGRVGTRVFDDPLGVVGGSSSSSTALGGKNGSSSGLLGVRKNQQRQLVQAPSSAPAAPRGMLGQLLSASGLTSPSFSPPGPGSFLSSSPQLPFAFTPSAASLGVSMMSFADQHGGGSGSSSSKGGPLSVSPMMHDLLVDPGLMGCSSSQGSHHGPGGVGAGTGSSEGRPGDLLMARMSSRGPLHQRGGSTGSRVLVPAVVVPGGFEGQGGTAGDTGGTAGAARSCRQENPKTVGGEAAEAGRVLAAADDTGQATAAAAAVVVGHQDGRRRDDRQQLVGEHDAGGAGDAEAAAGDAGAQGGQLLTSARAEESERGTRVLSGGSCLGEVQE